MSAQGWGVDAWTPATAEVNGKTYLTGVTAKGSRLHSAGADIMEIEDGASYLVCAQGWIQKGNKMSRSEQGCATITIPEAEVEEVEQGDGDGEMVQETSEDGILSGLETVDGAGAGRDEAGMAIPVQVAAESHATALAFSFAAVALSAIVM